MRGSVIRQRLYITTISAVKRGDVAELVKLQAIKITHFFSFTSSSILGMVQNLKNQTVTKIKQRKSSSFKDIVRLDSNCLLRWHQTPWTQYVPAQWMTSNWSLLLAEVVELWMESSLFLHRCQQVCLKHSCPYQKAVADPVFSQRQCRILPCQGPQTDAAKHFNCLKIAVQFAMVHLPNTVILLDFIKK